MIQGIGKKASVDIFEKRACKVYDVTTKTLISTHESLSDCAKEYGLMVEHVHAIIKYKHRNRSNNKGLIIAIR